MTVFNFKDEQNKRGIPNQRFDVRVMFAAMVKAEQERMKQQGEKK